ncbi:hypothetical protein LPJ78_005694 [Coemansia sp. RSA 989]|nr:mitochondrial ribosomal protein L28-domain-containing protein [Coemansia mojavensis]KAJ1738328.1 hypothetical protein LPJ68_005638 [Coemansia sp. RSA 1086]KAJ1746793.1 hypothetical protein LPJ79_005676 [Coemansia sp. RSA 1821]KAJ1860764.1 hypothetical protein LPJ78_005694 [Coemansia sp. RSA 989]KAJ1868931.1 hypothetical protein LPJ55_005696 [Coemansia sp. RSA 990]KAJ2629420.1 hypothetical protein H4R22_003330 [Coemansia sp. RSA 1290]KAJ2648910.1 hypothetical protein IWW40_003569 [Coemansia
MSIVGRLTSLSTRHSTSLQRATKITKAIKKAAAEKGTGHNTSDSRYELIKQILYYQEPRELPPISEEDIERHMTILRAEKISKMTASAQRRAERERKFAAMEKAYEALATADPRLYEAACKKESTATFPLEMRVPTETPSLKIWDYMKPSQ